MITIYKTQWSPDKITQKEHKISNLKNNSKITRIHECNEKYMMKIFLVILVSILS